MKPHPPPHRIRKTIKWGGAAVTVLLVVMWIASGRWSTSGVFPTRDSWQFACGALFIMCPRDNDPFRPIGYRGIMRVGQGQGYVWQPSWGTFQKPGSWYVQFPIWIVLVLTGPATAIAWRADVKATQLARVHLCRKCGYDRTGILKDAKCPECGEVPVSV